MASFLLVSLEEISFEDRPVYFVSSNTHSLANVLSGFALRQKDNLVDHVLHSGAPDIKKEYEDIRARSVPSSSENFLYYVLKKYEADHPNVAAERVAHDRVGDVSTRADVRSAGAPARRVVEHAAGHVRARVAVPQVNVFARRHRLPGARESAADNRCRLAIIE